MTFVLGIVCAPAKTIQRSPRLSVVADFYTHHDGSVKRDHRARLYLALSTNWE
jgi:hypothetical protein